MLAYKLVAIVGPTASGKSALAMKLAESIDLEIIAADSRTIYKGMDIGTAKPSQVDQAKVSHWGLDLVNPDETYSAFEFKKYAEAKIEEIKAREHLPVIVGGTGLYIDSLLFDFKFREPADRNLRQELESKTAEELQTIIDEYGYKRPQNFGNPRHLIRTIETKGQEVSRSPQLPEGTVIVGILPTDEALKISIHLRTKAMLEDGFVDEVKILLDRYGKMAALNGMGYKEVGDYLKDKISLAEAIKLFETAQWQYAKRQRTWFKRNPYIKWFDSQDSAYEAIKTLVK